MTETSRMADGARLMEDTTRGSATETDYAPPVSGWAGWIVFGGIILMLTGAFQIIEGLVALLDPGFYLVSANGLVVHVNYTTWGWAHLVIAVVSVLAGLGVLVGNLAARIAGVVVAGISALVNISFISAYPVWSTVVIALDVIVIFALIVHGREMKRLA